MQFDQMLADFTFPIHEAFIRIMRRAVLTVLLALLCSICVGWSGLPAAASTLVRGIEGEPGILDPAKASLNLEIEILNDLFLGLYEVGADGNPLPGCAAKLQQSADRKTITFHLRKDLKWSDGRALTAEDFVYSFRRVYDPKTAASITNYIRITNADAVASGKLAPEKLGVRATDQHTLVIDFETPVFDPERKFTMSLFLPVPMHVVEKHGANWSRAGVMVSNGPYTLRSWRKGAEIVLERNRNFHEASQVKISRVVYALVSDLSALAKRFRSGELDTTSNFPPADSNLLKRVLPKGAVRITPSRYIHYLQPNLTSALFKKRDIRRAIALAVDREMLVQRVLRSGQVANHSITPPGLPGYEQALPDYLGWDRARRLDEAKRLISRAGYSTANPLKIQYSYISLQSQKQVAIALAAMLKPVGIELELNARDAAVHYAMMDVYDFALAMASWSEGPDPEYFVYLMNSKSKPYNAGYASPAFDKAFSAATITTDPRKRMALFRDAEAIALADSAMIPLYVEANRALVSPKVQGWVDNVAGSHPSRWLSLAAERK